MRGIGLVSTGTLFVLASIAQTTSVDVAGIAQAMQGAARRQQQALCSYTAHRVYQLENRHLHPSAQMEVDVKYTRGEPKQFHITAVKATGVARRSLEDLLKEESQADEVGNEKSATAVRNYELSLIGDDVCEAGSCYKLTIEPKKKSKYLINGTAWVSKEDHMFVRIEGTMSKSPSFWLSRPAVEQRFSKIKGFWLPTFNRSTTKVLVLGEADLTIEYRSYSPQACPADGRSGG